MERTTFTATEAGSAIVLVARFADQLLSDKTLSDNMRAVIMKSKSAVQFKDTENGWSAELNVSIVRG